MSPPSLIYLNQHLSVFCSLIEQGRRIMSLPLLNISRGIFHSSCTRGYMYESTLDETTSSTNIHFFQVKHLVTMAEPGPMNPAQKSVHGPYKKCSSSALHLSSQQLYTWFSVELSAPLTQSTSPAYEPSDLHSSSFSTISYVSVPSSAVQEFKLPAIPIL